MDGLKRVTETEQREGLSRVRLLGSLGLHQEALKALKDLASKDPTVLSSIPDDLQYLSGGKIGLWRTLRREIEPTGRPLGEILAILALFLFVLVWGYFRWCKPPYLEIKFEDSTIEKELDKSFTALMNDALKRLATGAS